MLNDTVTTGALIKRINRKLALEGQKLIKSGGEAVRTEMGDYYIIDDHNFLVLYRVNLEVLARDLGVLGADRLSDN
jgi:hypothetical protein